VQRLSLGVFSTFTNIISLISKDTLLVFDRQVCSIGLTHPPRARVWVGRLGVGVGGVPRRRFCLSFILGEIVPVDCCCVFDCNDIEKALDIILSKQIQKLSMLMLTNVCKYNRKVFHFTKMEHNINMNWTIMASNEVQKRVKKRDTYSVMLAGKQITTIIYTYKPTVAPRSSGQNRLVAPMKL